MDYIKYIFSDLKNPLSFKIKYFFEKLLKIPFLFLKYTCGISNIKIPFLFSKDYLIENTDGIWKIRAGTDYDTLIRPDFEKSFRKYFQVNGGVFIDIGAHIGKWSLFIAQQNKNNRVFSFEPNPVTYPYLLENISLNQLSNISPINSGVGSEEAILRFHCDSLNTGQSGIRDSGETQIQVNSLDNFLNDLKIDISEIRLIKIDVEGFEWEVLQGMKKVLSKDSDISIICEIFPESEKKRKILKYMDDFSFHTYEIDESNFFFTK